MKNSLHPESVIRVIRYIYHLFILHTNISFLLIFICEYFLFVLLYLFVPFILLNIIFIIDILDILPLLVVVVFLLYIIQNLFAVNFGRSGWCVEMKLEICFEIRYRGKFLAEF